MPKMNKKAKNPFEKLPDEFKSGLESMKNEEVRDRIAKVALDSASLREAKKNDQDLSDKQEMAKEASAVYREGIKMNDLKVRFAKFLLESRGQPT